MIAAPSPTSPAQPTRSGTEGSWTLHFADGEKMFIYDAAGISRRRRTPLCDRRKEYGSGSSRDWAAKGTRLLASAPSWPESYERIHRSNLVGMGVLPLEFKPGEQSRVPWPDRHEGFDVEGSLP